MRHVSIHIAIVLIILSCGFSCSSGTKMTDIRNDYTLVGKWTGVDRTGKQGSFEFFDDNSMVLIIDGNSLGGQDPNGLGRLKYTADYSKKPIPLDITGVDQEGLEPGKVLMIVNFQSKDKIIIKTYFNEVRPDNSNRETDYVFILERQPR
jgi:hypothetical protein